MKSFIEIDPKLRP